jgi:hypothetical protein
LGTCRKIRG